MIRADEAGDDNSDKDDDDDVEEDDDDDVEEEEVDWDCDSSTGKSPEGE